MDLLIIDYYAFTKKSTISLIFMLFVTEYSLANYYSPRIELGTKIGNYRNISRTSVVVPLMSQKDRILYFTGIGMFDSKDAKEWNMWFGYRHMLSNSILGVFGHYDIRKSKHAKKHHQVTVGLEYLGPRFEYRLNGYVPISNKHKLRAKQLGISDYTVIDSENLIVGKQYLGVYDMALSGMDIECGGRILDSQFAAYIGYYHFGFDSSKEMVNGPRLRINGNINNYVKITSEIQRDNYRGIQAYVGLELKISIGNNKISDNFSLSEKMVQMPIRDIDVVVVDAEEIYKELQARPYKLIYNASELDETLKAMAASEGALDGGESSSSAGDSVVNTKELTKEERRAQQLADKKKAKKSANKVMKAQTKQVEPLKGNTVLLIANDLDYSSVMGGMLKPYRVTEIDMVGISDPEEVRVREVGSHATRQSNTLLTGDTQREISGFAILCKGKDKIGFFKELNNSVIMNLVFAGKMIVGGTGTGGVAGLAHNSKFYNVTNATPISILKTDKKEKQIGGIVGGADNVHFYKCENNAEIKAPESSYVGGIVGALFNSRVKDAKNSKKVQGAEAVGGIVGNASKRSTIEGDIINDAEIGINQSSVVGGIVGYLINSRVENATNSRSVIGVSCVGGIAGQAAEKSTIEGDIINEAKIGANESEAVGGIVGHLINSSIKNATNSGSVIGAKAIGGIVGQAKGKSTIEGDIINDAEIGINESELVGGIVGLLFNSSIGKAENSGEVKGSLGLEA